MFVFVFLECAFRGRKFVFCFGVGKVGAVVDVVFFCSGVCAIDTGFFFRVVFVDGAIRVVFKVIEML